MKKGAIFSSCRKYRYVLWRIWDESKPLIMFIGLNPSIADENKDDPTIRKCINLSKYWGYGGFYITNLFAYKSTDFNKIKSIDNPIGKENDRWIKKIIKRASDIVICWGNKGRYLNRDKELLKFIDNVKCLGMTKCGCPKHPLYVNSKSKFSNY